MNILVAIDESPYSKCALETVIKRPWPEAAHFKVVNIVEPFHPEYAGWHTSYVPLALEAQKELVEAAKKLVDESRQMLTDAFPNHTIEAEVIEGYIKDKILEIAKHWPADLIIVGSHGRRGFTRFLLGSVSEAVVSHAPCSVEIVKMPHPHHEEGAAKADASHAGVKH